MAWGPQRSLVTKPVLVFRRKGHVVYLWIQDEMGKAKNSSRNLAKQRRRNNKKTVQPSEESVVDHKQALVGAMNTLG